MPVAAKEQELPEKMISDWFSGFIANIQFDKILMETGTAPKDVAAFYNSAIMGDIPSLVNQMRLTSSMYFIQQIVTDYLTELSTYNAFPLKLAFDFSDAKILVWAEIKTDDEKTEDALILSEAKANEKYSRNGFFISTTIVEECDNFAIPTHYRQVPLDGRFPSAHNPS